MKDRFEVKYKEGDKGWEPVTREEMMRALSNAYIEPDVIVFAMIDGLIATTLFANYRVVPI